MEELGVDAELAKRVRAGLVPHSHARRQLEAFEAEAARNPEPQRPDLPDVYRAEDFSSTRAQFGGSGFKVWVTRDCDLSTVGEHFVDGDGLASDPGRLIEESFLAGLVAGLNQSRKDGR